MNSKNNCLLCGKRLMYFDKPKELQCAICGKSFTDNVACENEHYICNECHSESAVELIAAVCRNTPEKNPVKILLSLMQQPCVHMHGPEHHVLVGAALLAAWKNCGGSLEIKSAIDEMVRRGKQVPGGICGFWGCCGAAVSAGIAVSIITGSTPLKDEEWKLSNEMTAKALAVIAEGGGPRCCKRDSFAAVEAAAAFLQEKLGLQLEMPPKILCGYSPLNEECQKERCKYYPPRSKKELANSNEKEK